MYIYIYINIINGFPINHICLISDIIINGFLHFPEACVAGRMSQASKWYKLMISAVNG
jgi:hypothetical protein